jgi:hypothetical protein
MVKHIMTAMQWFNEEGGLQQRQGLSKHGVTGELHMP